MSKTRAVFKIANISKLDYLVTNIDLKKEKDLLEKINYIHVPVK